MCYCTPVLSDADITGVFGTFPQVYLTAAVITYIYLLCYYLLSSPFSSEKMEQLEENV